MFTSVLVANRGEIACRIIGTLRRLRIRAIAVWSDADRLARHVALADQAMRIGPPPATESYLRIDAIIEAAARAGAEAIHPGYGFLSENPAFAARLRRGRAHLRRAAGGGDRGDGRQGSRQGPDGRGRRAAGPGLRRRQPGRRRAPRGGAGTGLPGADQGRGRWWRQGHAGGRRAGRLRGRARRCEARGGIGVRRRSGPSGALSGATAAYRGADLRRPARPDRAPVRARLLGAAASPEGDRGGASTGPLARAAQHARRRMRSAPARPSATSTPAPSSS